MSTAITVRIDRAALEAADACDGGLALFDALLVHQTEERARSGLRPLRHLRIRWTPLHALWSAGVYPGFSRWLYERGLIPQISLAGANLVGADLVGANLVGANLVGANLARANLVGADLAGANLARANLVGADLAGANLVGADLVGANLAGADLVGANLAGAYRPSDPPAGWAPDSFGYLRRAP